MRIDFFDDRYFCVFKTCFKKAIGCDFELGNLWHSKIMSLVEFLGDSLHGVVEKKHAEIFDAGRDSMLKELSSGSGARHKLLEKIDKNITEKQKELRELTTTVEKVKKYKLDFLCDRIKVENGETFSGAFSIDESHDVGVYFLLKDNEVVYVGQSRCISSRIATHKADREKDFTHYAFLRVALEDLLPVESLYIQKLKPKYNKSYPSHRLHPHKGVQSHIVTVADVHRLLAPTETAQATT